MSALTPERVEPGRWRDAVADAIAVGGRPVALHAAAGEVRLVVARPDGRDLLLACPVVDGATPSLLEVAPWLQWGEREAHDLYGVRFDGHEPLRPLVRHDLDLASWTVPVEGHDAYQVAVGPTHAGVIESGHFRFHVVGERILHLDVRLFYTHRGLERAAEGSALADGLAYAQRACAACAVTNTVAYAQACEQALGLAPDDEVRASRTVLLELERLYNHVYDIGQLCAGTGFAAGTMAFLSLKERAQRLNARIAGHRFLFGTVRVGEGAFGLDAAAAAEVRAEIRAIGEDAARAWRQVQFNGPVQDRLDEVGVVTHDWARRLGTVGPAARASGIRHDVRCESPRLDYDGFEPAAPTRPVGDIQTRLELRALELGPCVDTLDRLLAGALPAGRAVAGGEPGAHGIGRVESPRGETVCAVEAADGRVARFHLRTGSNANWPSAGHAAADNLLPDFPLINKSFELCYSCSDR